MNNNAIDICVVDGDSEQRETLRRSLEPHGYSIAEAVDGPEGLKTIYQERPKVVICGLQLPSLSGLQICRHLRADPTLDGTYVIVIAGQERPGNKTRTLQAGADDYIQKPLHIEEVLARVRNGLRFHRLQEQLRRNALVDGLTDLWNHASFRDQLENEFQRTRRYGGEVTLMMVDLDHFKAINDTYGHEVGNSVLKLTARHLKNGVRETDRVARYGGEEFAVICPETSLDDAAGLAERLRETLPIHVQLPAQPDLLIHASFGLASSSDPRVQSVSDLINLSDQSLYQSKHAGRNRVTRCDRLDAADPDPAMRAPEVERLRKEVVALSLRAKEYCLQSVWALIQALEARDGYSAWHSRNVTLYTKWLVEDMGWPKQLKTAIANAAMLHDLGKIGLPDDLLLKPQSSNPAEAALLREVPLVTCKILEPLRVFETETTIIRHLRERWDGAGFPDGLRETSIPIGSRLLAITEAFDSITCNRGHRGGKSIDQALDAIDAAAGTQFDPEFCQRLRASVNRQRERWQQQVNRARIEMPEIVAAQHG